MFATECTGGEVQKAFNLKEIDVGQVRYKANALHQTSELCSPFEVLSWSAPSLVSLNVEDFNRE